MSADNWASKQEDDNPPQSPYSVETPYGFHLDLDFLKYVDDIEKGNTIKRIPIHRKSKPPKFSTLPRNFSLPENGSKAYSCSTNKNSSAQRKASLGAEESSPLVTPIDSALPNEPSYRRKALLKETLKQDPAHLNGETGTCRGRPQLLRASSMPATLPPSQNSKEESQPASLKSPDGKGLEFNFSPVKESLKLDKAQLVLEQQELPKERVQLSAPWQSQHLISQELIVVSESGEKECDAAETNTCPPSFQSGLPSSRDLENKFEKQSKQEIELSICETVNEVLEEDECASPGRREMEGNSNLGLLPFEDPSKITALKQHIAILEEQLNNKTEELEQIRVVLKQQDMEIKAKERSIEMLASSKAQLEEKLCGKSMKEIKPHMHTKNILQYHDAAVNTEHESKKGAEGAYDKGINVSITLPVKSTGCDAYEVDNRNLQVKEIHRNVTYGHHERTSIPVSVQEKDSPSSQRRKMGQDNDSSTLELSYSQLKVDEHTDNGNSLKEAHNHGLQCSVAGSESCLGVEIADSKAGATFQENVMQDLNEEKSHPDPKDSPADPTVGQYIKKIQDLLQEQWMCLEHGYPELASAIKQPASKLSSIQNQLVNSLNLLLSAYSTQTPTDKENSNTQYQQLENSPSTSLKSIMKKKDSGLHAGGNSTKKNLQFVGVNGGYETTSSEDSSCEESSSEGNSDSETERTCGHEEHKWGQGGNEHAQPGPETLPYARKEATDPEDQEETRHVLSTICQEWFRISSRKSSSPEIVAAYLQAVEAIHPQLQNAIVNLADGNGNTALHYSVSHSNFQIVKLLLDTGVCDVDHQNKAGYTAVMITPLASAETEEEMDVVTKLLKEGNVNIRASQGGQTALILGVSHDREDMVKALLSCGADINLRDDTGLSPLMVACQYGNIEIVKLLLTHPSCDATLIDKVREKCPVRLPTSSSPCAPFVILDMM
uniref:KN motif and ankyrin repeat domains 4 n=1 Tax=Varanus komodoensis TaxID=61221 RepID=A0A8D2L7I7_VARKO